MKKVTLKRMALVNFRGHKNLSVDFSKETTISGDNRLGKSTIFDAFVWLLFGKDQFDRKDHEIIPIVDGKRLERVDSEVTAIISVDGREMELKRVLHQKWVRRRGAIEEVYDGCDTQYWVNDVPKKAGEYKTIIDMIIEETIFKLITNTSAFLSLHWTKQREFLLQMAGAVSDDEIAQNNPDFMALLDMVDGKSLADFKIELAARKKKLKTELDTISPKIDQTARLMPESRDFAAIEKQIAETDALIEEIDEQLADRAKAIKGQYDEIQAKQKQINDLKIAQLTLVNTCNNESIQRAFAANQERNELMNILTDANRKLSEAINKANNDARTLNEYNNKVATQEAEITKLRALWNEENEKEYKAVDGCLICPIFNTACADPSAIGKHSEAQEKAKAVFFDDKQKKLEEITNIGSAKSKELNQMKTEVEVQKNMLNAANKAVDSLRIKVQDLEDKLKVTPETTPASVVPNSIPEYVKLQEQIEAITASISNEKPVDNSDLQSKKSELVIKRDELKKQLADHDLITRYKGEMEKLKNDAYNYAQQIADLEKREFMIAKFNKARIDECERRINDMFKIVKFQMFDKTIDGNEFECCIATNKAGVPISTTNTAEQINAGLDIINALSKHYNVSAPIFVDRAESVNRFIDPTTQMIYVRVSKEPVLTISN